MDWHESSCYFETCEFDLFSKSNSHHYRLSNQEEDTGIDIASSIFERQASGYLHKPLSYTENPLLDMSLFLDPVAFAQPLKISSCLMRLSTQDSY